VDALQTLEPPRPAFNLRKHGVTFEEAASVFGDPLSALFDDPEHSYSESRLLLFGHSSVRRLLVVSFTESEDAVRIISARQMTRREAREYESGLQL
jgi:uncharacterized protein